MATQIVELTGDEAALLRSLDKVIQKQLEYERKLRDTGETGDAAGNAIADAMAKVQRESDKALRGVLGDLKSLGPEGQAAAEALKGHLTEAGKAGFRSMDAVLEQLRLIDPTAAAAAEQAATEIKAKLAEDALQKVKVESDKALNGMVGDLRSLGPEGAAAAEALKGHFLEAGKAGHQSVEQVLEQLRQMDPTAAAAAEQAAAKIRDELGRAAQYSEGEFAQVLNELRSLGPQGKQAADELRKHLVDAGQIAEKSMADIVAELEKVNPAAAQAGAAIVASIQKGDSMFKSFGASAVREVTAIAGAYVGVQEAIQIVNDYLTLQRDLIKEANEAQQQLAKSQQDASKNLAALSPAERQSLLAQAPEIASQAGFGDVNAITEALGTVASTGLNDPTKIAEIVRQTARLERLSPDNLAASAAGAADVQVKTGLSDIREALALVADTGAESLVGDPAKLAANLPKALAAGAATAPGQDSAEAARQSAAIFAAATVVGDDQQGNSSATFAIDLLVRMDKFFENMSEEQVKARSQIELIDRKIEKGKDTEKDRLKKGQLSDFLSASEGVQDPGTIFGRLSVLQRSETLASQFQGESGFGEKQFQPFLKGLLDGQSTIATNVAASFGRIGASAEKFETIAKELESSTPQLTTATFTARQAGLVSGQQAADSESAALDAIRQAGADALQNTLPGGLNGFFGNLLDRTRTGGLEGTTAAEEGLSLIQTLIGRANVIRDDGIQAGDQAKLDTINATIGNVQNYLISQGAQGTLDPEGVQRARERAAELELLFSRGEAADARAEQFYASIENLLATIASKTGETASNTVPKPPLATPALSAQQP
jgi:hypothetical protein